MIVFAYGSNLCEEQMLERCPGAKFISTARLEGFALAFAGYSSRWDGPVATLRVAERACVHGVCYRVTAEDLARLDRFEGHPIVYRRRRVHVQAALGVRLPVELYTLRHASTFERERPSLEYVATIKRGFDAWGLPKRALAAAVRRCA